MDHEIFHITHIRNLSGIIQSGLLCDDRSGATHTTVDIGMPTIKERRRTTRITCGRRGTPSHYVPFYFGPRSPMLYSIWRGNVPTYADGQDPVIYLVTSVQTLRDRGLQGIYTDGNAGAAYVQFFEDDDHSLETAIDWPLMRETYWNNIPTDPDRANRRQAEYLVHDVVPLTASNSSPPGRARASRPGKRDPSTGRSRPTGFCQTRLVLLVK